MVARVATIVALLGLLLGALFNELLFRVAYAGRPEMARVQARESREEAARLMRELGELQHRISQHEERLRVLGDAALDCKLGYVEFRLNRRVASLP